MEVIVNQETAESTTVEMDERIADEKPTKRRGPGRRSREELQRYREEKARLEQETFPVCGTHPDCHAWNDGRCIALVNNDFGSRNCPFYKNRDVNQAEQRDCLEHLIGTGRTDLVRKYRKPMLKLGIFGLVDSYTDKAAEELDRFSDECLQELLSETAGGDTGEGGDWDD